MRLSSESVCRGVLLAALVGVCLLVGGARSARAQVFQFSPQDYTVGSNNTVTLQGYIVNNTASTVFINGYSFSLNPQDNGITASNFFNDVPASLAAGASYGSATTPLAIIDLTTKNAPPQFLSDSVILLGGSDATMKAALGNPAAFTVAVVPECSTGIEGGIGLVVLGIFVVRRRAAARQI